jgi:membrane protein DedA with SNARE-associated domain
MRNLLLDTAIYAIVVFAASTVWHGVLLVYLFLFGGNVATMTDIAVRVGYSAFLFVVAVVVGAITVEREPKDDELR